MESDFGVPGELSDLQKKRAEYQPGLPHASRCFLCCFSRLLSASSSPFLCLLSESFKPGTTVRVEFGDFTTTADPASNHVISHSFPHTYGQRLAHFLRATAKIPDAQIITEHQVGVVFCGRQSPGGHNVIWGLYDTIKLHNPKSTLIGFVGGTEGLFAQKTLEVTNEILSAYKNQGGYDMLGRTKDQIRTTEQVNAALKLVKLYSLMGVTSNTDAAQLAETFAVAGCSTKVVGVPVTLNGDLKNQFVEANVGFDTVCKINSQLISNVCVDALSAEKYYYFIRLMGRKASHVALECTLQSHPNMVILGEEVAASKLTIFDITKQICDAVQARAEQDKYHGVVLIPEGLVESIPELYALLQVFLRKKSPSQLSPWASALFEFLPLSSEDRFLPTFLLLHPESDDSAQLSQIEMEKLLAQLVETEINKRLHLQGKKFNAICHFFGYQARGSLSFKVLGHICYHILAAGLNGYMAMMTVKQWARGQGSSSIGSLLFHPATVDLKGKAYGYLQKPGPTPVRRPGIRLEDHTLSVEDQDYMGRIKKLQDYLDKHREAGCSQDVLKAALSAMASVTDILSVMSSPSYGSHPPPLCEFRPQKSEILPNR
ncbi:unnamed protein product [Spirodela intermedia]|uniref:Phosphofructokinase domain-containing protein n=1 Tax=Spirodela intermedia TaxID=51605 RepID=A0A7I8JK92_SPIIN|nr:unnamed protein product [Spirodela intermedia]CAA6670205.1 unnamed protein product [Spirodela intermedia]